MVGNLPNFNELDVFRCFLSIDEKAARAELAKKLQLGEGTVKSILRILKEKKLTESTNKGHVLSEKGKKVLKDILDIITVPKMIFSKNIYPNHIKSGILVKSYKEKKKTYALRDIAVKKGSEGALIFYFDKKLRLLESGYKQDFSELENYFDLKKDNLLILTFSKNLRTGENSALAIAFEINKKLKI